MEQNRSQKEMVRAPSPRERELMLPESGEMDTISLARAFVRCGWFKDLTDVAHALVKMQAGREAGFGPMASLMGVNIVQGKPTFSANMTASAIRNSKNYDFRVVESTDLRCEIAFFYKGEDIGHSTFTVEDAKKADLMSKDNWRKYPSDMLFSRALTRGCRRYAPDVFGGSTAYTPEEIGGDVRYYEPNEKEPPRVGVVVPPSAPTRAPDFTVTVDTETGEIQDDEDVATETVVINEDALLEAQLRNEAVVKLRELVEAKTKTGWAQYTKAWFAKNHNNLVTDVTVDELQRQIDVLESAEWGRTPK